MVSYPNEPYPTYGITKYIRADLDPSPSSEVREATRKLRSLVDWLDYHEDNPTLLLATLTPAEIERALAALTTQEDQRDD